MTSGVNQALPQISLPKIAAEGRTTRDLGGGADFAEALRSVPGNDKPAPAAAEDDAALPRHAWQRLMERIEHDASRPSISGPSISLAETDRDQPDDTVIAEDAWTGERPDIMTGSESSKIGKVKDPDRNEQQYPVGQDAAPAESAPDLEGDFASTRMPQTQPPAAAGSEVPTTTSFAGGKQDASLISLLRQEVIGREKDGARSSLQTRGLLLASMDRPSTSPPFVQMENSGQARPAAFEPVANVSTADIPALSSERSDLSEMQPDGPPVAEKATPRITLIGHQNIPAPASPTAMALVDSIASGNLLEPAITRFSFDALHSAPVHGSAQSLKIQLHPAELGMVTATLRFAGEQLSIELKVENNEAYRRLSVDSDMLVNSLRDLGYDVDRVTVVQPSTASNAARQDGAMSMGTAQGRSPEQFGQGPANGGGGGSGGRAPSNDDGGGSRDQQNQPGAQAKNHDSVYI